MRANSSTDILGHFATTFSTFVISGTRINRGLPELTFFRIWNEPPLLIAPIHSFKVLKVKHGAKTTPNTAGRSSINWMADLLNINLPV